jgi:hypothetical protein
MWMRSIELEIGAQGAASSDLGSGGPSSRARALQAVALPAAPVRVDQPGRSEGEQPQGEGDHEQVFSGSAEGQEDEPDRQHDAIAAPAVCHVP